MTPERLAEIRHAYARWDMNSGNWGTTNIADMVPELLAYVDELTRQRDDARDLAVRSGIFQDHRGTDHDIPRDLPEPLELTQAESDAFTQALEQQQ